MALIVAVRPGGERRASFPGDHGVQNTSIVLMVNNSALAHNSAEAGGAISSIFASTVTVNNSTLSANSAIYGGAIYCDAFATVTVNNSTLSGNSASQGGGIYIASASYVDDSGTVYVSTGTVTVLNSTFTGNIATAFGGGIANFGTLTARHNTLTGNSAPLGGDLYNAGLVYLFASTIGDRFDV